MDFDNLITMVKKLQRKQFKDNTTYYWITVSSEENDKITTSCFSVFAGFSKGSPRRELRKARPIDPFAVKKYLDKNNEPPLIIDNEEDIWVFYFFGGHAIIEKTICEEYYPDVAFPFEVVQLNPFDGYISIDDVPQKVTNRAPTKVDRMKVLKRDNFKCRLCGRSPKDYVDVELHLHHVILWSQGGLTIENNLLTLCKTCHDGLKPHSERMLLDYLEFEIPDFSKTDYHRKLRKYQEIVMKELIKENKSK